MIRTLERDIRLRPQRNTHNRQQKTGRTYLPSPTPRPKRKSGHIECAVDALTPRVKTRGPPRYLLPIGPFEQHRVVERQSWEQHAAESGDVRRRLLLRHHLRVADGVATAVTA